MQTIILRPLLHNNTENIALSFISNSVLNNIVKQIKGIKWSHSNKYWYLSLNKENYTALITVIKNNATIDNSLLRKWLEKRNSIGATLATPKNNSTAKPNTKTTACNLSPANLNA